MNNGEKITSNENIKFKSFKIEIFLSWENVHFAKKNLC